LLRAELGLWDKVPLSEADEKLLKECFERDFVRTAEEVVSLYNHNEKLASLAVEVLNRAAQIKWISLDHTGAQVPLYVKGAGEELFHNCYDNTDIPKAIAKAMGLTLEN
jgi:alkaline phosphatase